MEEENNPNDFDQTRSINKHREDENRNQQEKSLSFTPFPLKTLENFSLFLTPQSLVLMFFFQNQKKRGNTEEKKRNKDPFHLTKSSSKITNLLL